jgi:hypothetical protein
LERVADAGEAGVATALVFVIHLAPPRFAMSFGVHQDLRML